MVELFYLKTYHLMSYSDFVKRDFVSETELFDFSRHAISLAYNKVSDRMVDNIWMVEVDKEDAKLWTAETRCALRAVCYMHKIAYGESCPAIVEESLHLGGNVRRRGTSLEELSILATTAKVRFIVVDNRNRISIAGEEGGKFVSSTWICDHNSHWNILTGFGKVKFDISKSGVLQMSGYDIKAWKKEEWYSGREGNLLGSSDISDIKRWIINCRKSECDDYISRNKDIEMHTRILNMTIKEERIYVLSLSIEDAAIEKSHLGRRQAQMRMRMKRFGVSEDEVAKVVRRRRMLKCVKANNLEDYEELFERDPRDCFRV
jgi:hypothetical protein